MTLDELTAIVDGIAPTIRSVIDDRIKAATDPLRQRIAALEQERSELKYCGTWSADRAYVTGNFATSGGNVWHANRATARKPGDNNDDWTLAVRAGRDAR
jgi:hypothetical protein